MTRAGHNTGTACNSTQIAISRKRHFRSFHSLSYISNCKNLTSGCIGPVLLVGDKICICTMKINGSCAQKFTFILEIEFVQCLQNCVDGGSNMTPYRQGLEGGGVWGGGQRVKWKLQGGEEAGGGSGGIEDGKKLERASCKQAARSCPSVVNLAILSIKPQFSQHNTKEKYLGKTWLLSGLSQVNHDFCFVFCYICSTFASLDSL